MAEERSMRSVFVGNIPYEATEEQLKKIFSQVGPVVSFRLVYDRETGKPKGYGFCEYQDQETAQIAMKNLSNHDFNGRPLRVGVAAGDQAKDDMRVMQQMFGPSAESLYGDSCDPDRAPEAISKAVASLPPEQMYELMKQMQLCVRNNPNEARNMLIQNPQLSYALLQAQIIMKMVDPQTAMSLLYKKSDIQPILPSNSNGNGSNIVVNSNTVNNSVMNAPPPPIIEPMTIQSPVYVDQPPPSNMPPEFGVNLRGASNIQRSRGGLLGDMPPQGSRLMAPPFPGDARAEFGSNMNAPRPEINMADPRVNNPPPFRNETRDAPPMRRPEMDDRRDVRPVDGMNKRPPPPHDQPVNRGPQNLGPPNRQMRDMGGPRPMDPRFGEDRFRDNRGPPDNIGGPRNFRSPVYEEGGRGYEGNYRGDNMRANDPGMRRHLGPPPESMDTDLRSRGAPSNFPQNPGPPRQNQELPRDQNVSIQDQEKAALIIQVLQLSDDQIALLPPDQRNSILVLKEQIAKSGSN